MPSPRDCAERLREQAYRTLTPQLQDLGEELQNVGTSLSNGISRLERKLEALRHIELPTTESILSEILGDALRNRELEVHTLSLFARSLREKETQEELLNLLLDTAATCFSCVALYSVRGDRLIGWSSRGLSETAAKTVSTDSFTWSEFPAFQDALGSEDPVATSDLPDSFGSLHNNGKNDGAMNFWRLYPLRVMQRPAALLITGGTEEYPTAPESVSTMTGFTALRLENIALRILHEISTATPMPEPSSLTETGRAETGDSFTRPAVESESERGSVEEAATSPAVSIPDRDDEPALVTTETGFGIKMPSDAPGQEFQEFIDGESSPASAHDDLESQDAVAGNTYMPRETVTENKLPDHEYFENSAGDQAANESATGISDIPTTPHPQPPQQPPDTSALTPEEEKQHSDAKRFARLLVTEIKLYNETKVTEGRQHHDLFARLKRDIERSREMYEKRVSVAITSKFDYFHEELVRILGDNEPSTLGNDYPGPFTES
jgi:hypothetical protein